MTGLQAVEKLVEFLEFGIENPTLKLVVLDLLARPEFATAPGGVTRHHAYPGGLAVHTLEVVQLAFEECRSDVMVAAAVLHDYAKIWAYQLLVRQCSKVDGKCDLGMDGCCVYCHQTMYVKTEQERKVGHVVESWRLFMAQAEMHGLDGNLMLEVGHAMLAHHGRREWGSPVEARTREAFALHAADMLSMFAQGGEEKR